MAELNFNFRLSFQTMRRRSWRQRLLEWPWRPWQAIVWEEVTGGELAEMIDKVHSAVHRTLDQQTKGLQ